MKITLEMIDSAKGNRQESGIRFFLFFPRLPKRV